MAENEDLSPEQTEKLLQFQDLSGIEDMGQCREMMQRHNWDIEVAVQSQFSEQEGRPSVFNEPRREPRTPPVNAHPRDQSAGIIFRRQNLTYKDDPRTKRVKFRVYMVAPVRQRPTGIFGWANFILSFPFRFVYSTFMDIFRFTYRLLRPDPRRYVTDPLGDVTTFIQQYEEIYGTEHPTFYQGSYSQALNDAKRELKFLLVYLHGNDHQDTAQFCRSTLCDSTVIEYINTNLLFWGCDTRSPEGYRVSQALRENTYPFMALIVLRNNRMTVVARIEGPIEAADLVTRLTRMMEDNETSLVSARLEREERSFNQTLRDDQDRAYLESLKADQEKERKKQEVKDKIEKEEQEVQEKEMEEQRLLEERVQRKEMVRDQIPPEPDSDDPDVIKILLKLPNGTRLERRFLKSQSLLHLHDYLFVHEAAPDDFQIVTNFPRRVLPCHPQENNETPPTFADVGLGKTEMLFVQDNEA